jgi:putative transposase
MNTKTCKFNPSFQLLSPQYGYGEQKFAELYLDWLNSMDPYASTLEQAQLTLGLRAHLIFLTKSHQPALTANEITLIKKSFREMADGMDFQILEFNGEEDHVHTLVEYPPNLSLCQIVKALKSVSTQCCKQKSRKGTLWSNGAFVAAVGGPPIEVLMKYIEAILDLRGTGQ